mmetsp:Transcript_77146/g.223258  ORF Transcript_77146/g.223258 Transcript_77146/m.223258 type:complete len:201 (-) Transcript_77146:124-726(-)
MTRASAKADAFQVTSARARRTARSSTTNLGSLWDAIASLPSTPSPTAPTPRPTECGTRCPRRGCVKGSPQGREIAHGVGKTPACSPCRRWGTSPTEGRIVVMALVPTSGTTLRTQAPHIGAYVPSQTCSRENTRSIRRPSRTLPATSTSGRCMATTTGPGTTRGTETGVIACAACAQHENPPASPPERELGLSPAHDGVH